MAKKYLNRDWQFVVLTEEAEFAAMLTAEFDVSKGEIVTIPHTFKETPFNYFNEESYQMVGCYRKVFDLEELMADKTGSTSELLGVSNGTVPTSEQVLTDKSVILTIGAAAHVSDVYLNGKMICHSDCGYTAFSADMAPFLQAKNNVLVIRVDSNESLNVPPFGHVIDYMTYGGIYRDITVQVTDKAHITELYAAGTDLLTDKPLMKVQVRATKEAQGCGLRFNLYELETSVHSEGGTAKAPAFIAEPDKTVRGKLFSSYFEPFYGSVDIDPVTDTEITDILYQEFTFEVPGIKLWDLDTPNRYRLSVSLVKPVGSTEKSGAEPTDNTETAATPGGMEVLFGTEEVVFGFRESEYRKEGFFLNGKRVQLLGLNRHQSFPYVGYAMPDRAQILDADILKFELGCNTMRTSHYPQAPAFYDRCDEIGLLVVTEMPGWQHIGDDEWKNVAVKNVEHMVRQYRNHPSIILWGVRINESQDDDEFYTRTNAVAHKLDPYRQTGGIRNFAHSHLLEDVYTYNDFTNHGQNVGVDKRNRVSDAKDKPYMVTEYNGHMYPTKSYDDELHRREHALRHAQVIRDARLQPNISGNTGWCMFDYNTHRDFGSGDRICYHGVMDMFRNPKMASYVYSSQSDAFPVFFVGSTMDIGEYAGGEIGSTYIFTNADSVRLYKNGDFVKEFFPDKKEFGSMAHPPVVIDDPVGELLETKEGFSHKKSEAIKAELLAILHYGVNTLPLRHKLKLARLMVKYHLSYEDGLRLYGEYIGNWGGKATTYRFEAVRNGEVAEVVNKSGVNEVKLLLIPDSLSLCEDKTYDVGSVRIRMVDQNGHVVPYYQEPVTFETEGNLEIIGPKTTVLRGGMGGTYVRTTGAGSGKLTVRSGGDVQTLTYTITE